MDIFPFVKRLIRRNSTKILAGVGITGYFVTSIFSIRAYKECERRIEQRKEELGMDKLTTAETIKVCWKPAILPILSFTTSSICIIGAQNILLKKNAALLAAYKASETTLAEFKKQTKTTVGEEAYKKIQDKVTEKQIEQVEIPNKKTYLDDERELYYDGTYGGYFYATELEVYKAFEETRADIEWARNTTLGTGYRQMVLLGDLYFRLHNEPIGIGDDFGYDVEKYRCNKLDYMISNDFKTAPNGKKALVIYYDKADPID